MGVQFRNGDGVRGSGSGPRCPSVLFRVGRSDGKLLALVAQLPGPDAARCPVSMQAGSLSLADWNPVEAMIAARQQGSGVRRQACIRHKVFSPGISVLSS